MDGSGVHLRDVAPAKPGRNPISRKQIESVLSRSVGAFSLVFAAQTLPTLLKQYDDGAPVWTTSVVLALALSMFLALGASITHKFVYLTQGLVAVVYVAALVSWPFAVVTPTPERNHWIYYLLTVATASACIGFPKNLAAGYLFVVPAIYGVIRITKEGGSASVSQATLDAIYAVILGGAVMVIATMLRQAASSVDVAQATALDRYAHAVRQHATDVERVQVDAIVHDSVLTTLLSAARAYTPETKQLAATMAGNAINHLHEAAMVVPDDGTTVRLKDVARRIGDAASKMSPRFELQVQDIGPRAMPVQASEAIYSAAMQAMVNSVQHAGDNPVHRWVMMHGTGLGGVQVEVGDNGKGFSPVAVPTERLGVRVSIIERVANAGGFADIQSAPGVGTLVTIRWPSVDSLGVSPSGDITALGARGEEAL